MAKATDAVTLELEGHEVSITHPDHVVFPTSGFTKLDLVQYLR